MDTSTLQRERGIPIAYGIAMGILSRKISGLKRRNVKNFIKWTTNKKVWRTHLCPAHQEYTEKRKLVMGDFGRNKSGQI
jgi:hypothetical protein